MGRNNLPVFSCCFLSHPPNPPAPETLFPRFAFSPSPGAAPRLVSSPISSSTPPTHTIPSLWYCFFFKPERFAILRYGRGRLVAHRVPPDALYMGQNFVPFPFFPPRPCIWSRYPPMILLSTTYCVLAHLTRPIPTTHVETLTEQHSPLPHAPLPFSPPKAPLPSPPLPRPSPPPPPATGRPRQRPAYKDPHVGLCPLDLLPVLLRYPA